MFFEKDMANFNKKKIHVIKKSFKIVLKKRQIYVYCKGFKRRKFVVKLLKSKTKCIANFYCSKLLLS